jgi:hypothetical protein
LLSGREKDFAKEMRGSGTFIAQEMRGSGFRQGEIRVSPSIERGEAYRHGERNRIMEGRGLSHWEFN